MSTKVTYSQYHAIEALLGAVNILDVWRALGGGEIRGGRGRAFWRDGNGFNVAINSERGVWHDFVPNEGGGVLKLIQIVRNCSKAEAYQFLADLTGVALVPNSPAQRRCYAAARQDAAALARLAGRWLQARRAELEEKKRACNGDEGPWDEQALTAASSELWRLEQMDAAGVFREWGLSRQSNLSRTRDLEHVGEIWDRACRRILNRVMDWLAETESSESEGCNEDRHYSSRSGCHALSHEQRLRGGRLAEAGTDPKRTSARARPSPKTFSRIRSVPWWRT